MTSRRNFLIAASALPLAAVFGLPAQAAQPPVFATGGVAINGYDPVAYFTQSAPVAGQSAHSLNWNGAEWRFASAENKAMFEADPETYAPQFGGYCAYAVSKGYTATTAPEAWTVHDGKLYLNFSLRARDLWSQDIPGNIAKGNANWPDVLNA